MKTYSKIILLIFAISFGLVDHTYENIFASEDTDILDLIVSNMNSNEVSVLLGNDKGTFSTTTNFDVGTGSLFVCDLR